METKDIVIMQDCFDRLHGELIDVIATEEDSAKQALAKTHLFNIIREYNAVCRELGFTPKHGVKFRD